MSNFEEHGCNSGTGLADYLKNKGIAIEKTYGLEKVDNYIILENHTSLNWKKKNSQVRVNCKKETMQLIESITGLHHIDNGAGDPTRPYSFLLDSFEELERVVEVLQQ